MSVILYHTYDNYPRLRTLPKNTDIALAGYNYRVFKGLELNNYYVELPWYQRQGEYVFIKCSIDSNAVGPLYGRYEDGTYEDNNARANIYIASGRVVQWRNGNTVKMSRTLDDKPHVIGWMAGQDDGTSDMAHRFYSPYLDGQTFSDIKLYDSGSSGHPYLCGFTSTNTGALYSTSTTAITVYEIAAYSYSSSSSNITWRVSYHEYAGKRTSVSTPTLISTLMHTSDTDRRCDAYPGPDVSDITQSRQLVDFDDNELGYGITIADLRQITGGGYHTLLETVWDDGGPDISVGSTSVLADNPSCAKETSTSTIRKFAFLLKLSSNQIPLPSGWTVDTTTAPTRYYEAVGELIYGRRPKWSIWANSIKFGKYAVTDGSSNQVVHFNIFRENNGTAVSKFDILKFDGYNPNAVNAPHLSMSEGITYEYHNGYCTRISQVETIISGGVDNKITDRNCMFAFNREGGGLAIVKLGNLPLWNYTEEEQNTNSGLNKLQAYGGGIIVKCEGDTIANMIKTVEDSGDTPSGVPRPFCSESTDATKEMFRTGGFDCTSVLRDKAVDYMKDMLLKHGSREITAKMVMVKDWNNDGSVRDGYIIDCSLLVPTKTSVATGIFDNYIFGTAINEYSRQLNGMQYDRFILGEQGGTANINGTECYINVLGDSNSDGRGAGNSVDEGFTKESVTLSSTSSSIGDALTLAFALKKRNTSYSDYRALLPIFGSGANPVMAYANVYSYARTVDSSHEDLLAIDGTTYVEYEVNGYFQGVEMNATNGTITKTETSSATTYVVSVPHTYNATEKSFGHLLFLTDDGKAYEANINYEQVTAGTYTVTLTRVSGSPNKTRVHVTLSTGTANVYTTIYSSLHISAKYFGFTKVVSTIYDATSNSYYTPLGASGYSHYWKTKIQPMNYDTTSTYAPTYLGCAMFMWKDLYGRGGTTTRPTDAITSHIKIYSSASATGGTHGFVPATSYDAASIQDAPSRNFSAKCECWYHDYSSAMGINQFRQMYYHNAGIIDDTMLSSQTTYVDAYVSLWDGTSQKIGSGAFTSLKLYVFEEPLHEPKERSSAGESGQQPKLLLNAVIDTNAYSENGQDLGNGYRLYITSQFTIPTYSHYPNADNGQFSNANGYRIVVRNTSTLPKTGCMYHVVIR